MTLKTRFRELVPILARTHPAFRGPFDPVPRRASVPHASADVVERIQHDVAELRSTQSELLRNQEELRAAVDALRARGAGS